MLDHGAAGGAPAIKRDPRPQQAIQTGKKDQRIVTVKRPALKA